MQTATPKRISEGMVAVSLAVPNVNAPTRPAIP
jgi:hypothetical protein